MKCVVLHQSRGRMRIRLCQPRMTLKQADILEYYLRSIAGVENAKVYDRTCDAVIVFKCDKRDIIDAIAKFSYAPNAALVPENTGRELNRKLEEKLVMTVLRRTLSRLLMPAPLHTAVTWCKASGHIRRGVNALRRGRIEVSLLDAVAITVSLL